MTENHGFAVAIAIVTHNSAGDLAACFQAIEKLSYRPIEVVLVDCASGDGSSAEAERLARSLPSEIHAMVVPLLENLGFAGGMNEAFSRTSAPWVLTLNADALPSPDYLDRLLERAARHPELQVGAVTGRLVRAGDPGEHPAILDACGMRLTRTWRHLDRGSGEVDSGQYTRAERVFGATGAASLFRRAALDDVSIDGEVFDPAFHSFREDAELCFRLRERGWEILYDPAAVAVHRRFNLPERRSSMPAQVNRHSLKNRYLLRLYHQTGGNFLRTALPTLGRDLLALGYAILRERTSLPAYSWLWRHRREILARRREIQGRRTIPPRALDRWFGIEGVPL
ncbi:MAG: glycosyltransferase family 2 protein [Acidobacteriota bacterium]